MMWDGFDKRKFPRINVRCDILMEFQGRPSSISTLTENLGSGGVCVVLDEPLERFESCRVRLVLEDHQAPIECPGRVVWVIQTKALKSRHKTYDTGVEFVELDPGARLRVEKVVEQYLKQNPLGK